MDADAPTQLQGDGADANAVNETANAKRFDLCISRLGDLRARLRSSLRLGAEYRDSSAEQACKDNSRAHSSLQSHKGDFGEQFGGTTVPANWIKGS